MSRRRNTLTVAGAAIVAAIAVLLIALWPRAAATPAEPAWVEPQRPRTPPPPGTKPERIAEPRMPPMVDRAWIEAKYEEAKRHGEARPGDAAFRATIDVFMEYNHDFAVAKAKKEGVTVDEIAELTYLGFLMLQSQGFMEVERLLGHALSADQTEQLEALMHGRNAEFSDTMHEKVAAGATEDERWAFIQETEAAYVREYLAISGMTARQFDELLAGDPTRTGAPIASDLPVPDDVRPDPRDELDPQRPGEPPR